MLILPSNPTRAQKLLHGVARQRAHCTAVVFGDTEDAREAASRADVRAENHPFRKVVWIPEPAVLEGDAVFAPLANAYAAGATTAFLTFSFDIAKQLAAADARKFRIIERGFIAAEIGES